MARRLVGRSTLHHLEGSGIWAIAGNRNRMEGYRVKFFYGVLLGLLIGYGIWGAPGAKAQTQYGVIASNNTLALKSHEALDSDWDRDWTLHYRAMVTWDGGGEVTWEVPDISMKVNNGGYSFQKEYLVSLANDILSLEK